jgi:hypothetical protein
MTALLRPIAPPGNATVAERYAEGENPGSGVHQGILPFGKILRMKRHLTRKKGIIAVLCGEIKIDVVLWDTNSVIKTVTRAPF